MWNKGPRFFLQKLVLSLAAAACLVPLALLVFQSFVYGGKISLDGFRRILLWRPTFYAWFWNSVKYTVGILLIEVPVSILAAFAFSHLSFPGSGVAFSCYVLLMLLPFQATVMPQYLLLNNMKMLDSPEAVILPWAYSAFGTFLLTQFMKGIDKSVLEASCLDGAGWFRQLTNMVLPICRPAVVSLVVLQFFSSWSMVDQPMLFLRREELMPLSLQLGSNAFGPDVFAAGALYALLPMLTYRYCQRAMEQGIRLSTVQ